MNFELTDSFQKKSKRLSLKNSRLKIALAKQFKIFSQDPKHPSLKTHKLQGERSSQIAIWIISDLRALAIKSGSKYIFFDLITHDEY